VATSFYLKSLVQRNLQVAFSPQALLAELRKTFNAADVSLLASGDLRWRSGGSSSVTQVVQIDGRDYALILTPRPKPGAVNFKVGVVEERGKDSVKNVLLDTEIVLPDGEVAMLGFRDSREQNYFIALYIQGRDEAFGKDSVRLAAGKKPKLIKKVNPVYPDEAVKSRIQGVVVLEAVIDEMGKVQEIRTVTSAAPMLDKAATEALQQWEYAPFEMDGRCRRVMFTVTIRFRLDEKKKDAMGALARLEDSQKPKLIKKIDPTYPQAALEHKLEGVVVLEVKINELGKVTDMRDVSSTSPTLKQAAIEAVRQWEYEPYIVDGKAKPVVFTVTVTFALK
jgi:TonB family protein